MGCTAGDSGSAVALLNAVPGCSNPSKSAGQCRPPTLNPGQAAVRRNEGPSHCELWPQKDMEQSLVWEWLS